MCDGCDEVTIKRSSRDGKIPYRHIVTIDADRHSFGGVTGTIIKGFLGGVLSTDNGAAPLPPRRAHDIFAAEVLKVS